MPKSKIKFHYKTVHSVDEINSTQWNSIPTNTIFLDLNYLISIEKTVSEITQFYYVIYYNDNNEAIGKSVFQKLQYNTSTFNMQSVPCEKSTKILQYFLKPKISVLIAGNIFATGDNIYSFNNNFSLESILYNINLVTNSIFKKDKSLNYSIFKEFNPNQNKTTTILENHQYLKFNIDVNMVLNLKSHWQNFNDLATDYRTKYRSRFKNVLLKSKDIEVKNLSVDDIKKNAIDFQKLYRQVLVNSNFNIGIFNIETFINLKEKLADKYTVFGYFKDDKLIGFRSAFKKNGDLETSFIGIDYSVNLKYNLYQRMLIDFIEFGFKNNVKVIGFGRTAETMKSAFGALPIHMNLFIRSRKKTGKFLLKLIVQNIKPTEYSLRKPFKKEFYSKVAIEKQEVVITKNTNCKKMQFCPLQVIKSVLTS